MSSIRPEEITSLLEQELQKFERSVETEHVGTVIQVGDSIARVYGLPDCQMGELLEFPNGVMGMALNLEEDAVGGVLFGEDPNTLLAMSRISCSTIILYRSPTPIS